MKLVYIAHGWHRGYFGKNLINDAVQAWRYGPVIPDLYRKIKHYGRNPIDSPIECYGLPGDGSAGNELPDEQTIELLDRVWEVYSDYSGPHLSALTHRAETPWHQIWERSGGDNYRGAIIPNELIEQHYKERIGNAE